MSYDYGLREIARHTGVTGVEAKNIARALHNQNIGYDVIDWKTLGEDSRDFGNRSGAVWNKLSSMYGVSKPSTIAGIKQDIGRFEESKMERPFDAIGFQYDLCNSIHLKRSRKAILLDDNIRADNVFKITDLVGVQKWMKAPNRFDILGVDYFPKKYKKRSKKRRK